jgi:hypothetical protein
MGRPSYFVKFAIAWAVLLVAAIAFAYVIWTAATPHQLTTQAEQRR